MICSLEAEHPFNPLSAGRWGACPSWTPLMLSHPPRLLPTGQAAVMGPGLSYSEIKHFRGSLAATRIHGLIFGRLASPSFPGGPLSEASPASGGLL